MMVKNAYTQNSQLFSTTFERFPDGVMTVSVFMVGRGERFNGGCKIGGIFEFGGTSGYFWREMNWRFEVWQFTNPHTSQDGDQHILASGKLKQNGCKYLLKINVPNSTY